MFRRLDSPLWGRLLILCCAAVVVRADTDATANALVAARREFQAAYAASQSNSAATADSPTLQNYILYPYLQAARLQFGVSDPTENSELNDAAVEDFLMRHGMEPVTRDLRRAWLLSLAKRAKWPLFVTYYRADVNDIELRCQALDAHIALQTSKELPATVAAQWLSAQRLPSACDAPMAWAQAQNLITPELIAQRASLALKAGNASLARELVRGLPSAQAEPLNQWLTLIEQPQAAIDALIANPSKSVDSAVLLDGWTRLARKDQDAAIARYSRFIEARKLDAHAAAPYTLALALALSWNRRPEAVSYFERVASGDLTDTAWEWYARAALWAGDWQRVAKITEAMPTAVKNPARWRYWSARAAEQLHDETAAAATYAQLIETEDNYYAAMAAARLKKTYTPHPIGVAADAALIKNLEARPALQRARELFFVDLKPQASYEWNLAYDALQPSEQAAAIHLAANWGWHELAIRTATRQSVFNDYALLYPRPYDQEVKAAVKLTSLPLDLVYGQMRQESLYSMDAQSSAGALGLMQLVPTTARATAKRWQRPLPKRDELFMPEVNVPLGAAELHDMIEKYDGQLVVALAAYNAGPNAAARWLPAAPMDSDVWIENIPYNETRNYVQKILWHSLVFRWLENKTPQEASAWVMKVHG